MSRGMTIQVVGMDEKDNGDEDDQQNVREGVDEGIRSGKMMNTAVEGARVTWHREDNSDMSDKINEGAIVTKILLNPDSIKDDYPIMDVTLNSLAHLNLSTNNQRADFLEQLEDIDNELLKFDNIHVKGKYLMIVFPKRIRAYKGSLLLLVLKHWAFTSIMMLQKRKL